MTFLVLLLTLSARTSDIRADRFGIKNKNTKVNIDLTMTYILRNIIFFAAIFFFSSMTDSDATNVNVSIYVEELSVTSFDRPHYENDAVLSVPHFV